MVGNNNDLPYDSELIILNGKMIPLSFSITMFLW